MSILADYELKALVNDKVGLSCRICARNVQYNPFDVPLVFAADYSKPGTLRDFWLAAMEHHEEYHGT